MPSPETKDIDSLQIGELFSKWGKEALPLEKSENVNRAVEIVLSCVASGKPIPIVSPICANYETYYIGGKPRPCLHNEMVWTDRGLRRGYVLLHEEIPWRLEQLAFTAGVGINYLMILVDIGMAPTLFGPQNFDYDRIPKGLSIDQHIERMLESNVKKIKELLAHGIEVRGISDRVKIAVRRLTRIIDQNFLNHWNSWNNFIYSCLASEEGDLKLRRIIDSVMRNQSAYYRNVWGLDKEGVEKRIIEQCFGLTAAVGDYFPFFYGSCYEGPSQEVIMLDTIPGPKNPAHEEFIMYNYPPTKPDGSPRLCLPILRPFLNLVLLSQPAVSIPGGKSLEEMIDEANNYGF